MSQFKISELLFVAQCCGVPRWLLSLPFLLQRISITEFLHCLIQAETYEFFFRLGQHSAT